MNRILVRIVSTLLVATAPIVHSADDPPASRDWVGIDFRWGVTIPMRDGVLLNANLYTPKEQKGPAPCIFTLTPYVAQGSHDRGVYFAAHGLPFLSVDVRGRGNSGGVFRPFIQEGQDGYDVVEWLAQQPYCNGKIASWGGSYMGYTQWALAKELPPHLATFVPVAAVYPGLDFPMRNNISYPHVVQWLTYTSGHTSQEKIYADQSFWAAIDRDWFEGGRRFSELDRLAGNPSAVYQEWLLHPQRDAYWDAQTPTPEQYQKLQIPILTITGSYDTDQPGALTYYQEHLRQVSPEARAKHYLIIGPWDHSGTRTPKTEFGGLKFGPASLLDLPRLHLAWYRWTMQAGTKPEFLRKPVAYYVMGAEKWRYADTLAAITARSEAYYLDSNGNADGVLESGSPAGHVPLPATSDHDYYIYDPRDTSGSALQSKLNSSSLFDQAADYAATGKQLIYHTAPFDKTTEVSGFFKLSAWLSIDQPDTDFEVSIYEIGADGSSIPLSLDWMRARYREGLRESRLISTTAPLLYDFEGFNFVSRQIRKGSRLRLVIGPINSLYRQKNYNSGGIVAEESMKDARPVTVTLYHSRAQSSTLYVPIGRPETSYELTAPSSSFVQAP